MLHGMQVPAGFDDDCADGTEMPLLSREMLEDDGGTVLSVSRSNRKNCGKYADGYAAFAERAGIKTTKDKNGNIVSEAEAAEVIVDESGNEIMVAETADAEAPTVLKDQVRSWVVANGQTLREVLQSWCDKEGWDLVWTTSREYPIQASAVFKGRFVDCQLETPLVLILIEETTLPVGTQYLNVIDLISDKLIPLHIVSLRSR